MCGVYRMWALLQCPSISWPQSHIKQRVERFLQGYLRLHLLQLLQLSDFRHALITHVPQGVVGSSPWFIPRSPSTNSKSPRLHFGCGHFAEFACHLNTVKWRLDAVVLPPCHPTPGTSGPQPVKHISILHMLSAFRVILTNIPHVCK
jgi:hypothetical protein